MAEAAQGKTRDEVDSGRRTEEHGTSDQVIDPWCEPCLEETSVKVSAVWYCPECNNHLCLSCKDFHKKWPMLQNHRLVQGPRMPKYHADKPIKYPNCASHAVNITDYFCLNNSQMVCSDCIKRDHQSCDFLPIPDVCKSLGLKDIKRLKSVVNDIQQNVKNTQTTLHQNIACIESQQRDIIKRAEIERDKLILKASEMFEETVTTISETCLKITTELTNGIETLSDENRQLNEIIDTIDKKTIADIDANIFVQIQNMVISTNECKTRNRRHS